MKTFYVSINKRIYIMSLDIKLLAKVFTITFLLASCVFVSIHLLTSVQKDSKQYPENHLYSCECCNIPFGRSRCFDCDKELAQNYCRSRRSEDSSRESLINKPNARLGYMD